MTPIARPAAALAALALAGPGLADPASILDAAATRTGETWRISVTLRHDDTGREDYADGWRVLAPDGTILGTRVLHHPHVAEQPFTRALSGVAIPAGLAAVEIEARTSASGWGGPRHVLEIPGR
jgi:hypothetical protein